MLMKERLTKTGVITVGYSHYWSKTGEVDNKKYAAALKDIAKIVKASHVKLANGAGEEGTKPELTNGIAFNGVGDDSHETFSLPKSAQSIQHEFCKTASKPYDILVVAALARLAEVPGIIVKSDGDTSDWQAGVALASKILGRKVANPLETNKLKTVSFVTAVTKKYVIKADKKQTFIKPGEEGEGIMPCSEVCMHMKIADKKMKFKFLPHNKMVQLLRPDGFPFSTPITQGEAGIYGPEGGKYYYYKE